MLPIQHDSKEPQKTKKLERFKKNIFNNWTQNGVDYSCSNLNQHCWIIFIAKEWKGEKKLSVGQYYKKVRYNTSSALPDSTFFYLFRRHRLVLAPVPRMLLTLKNLQQQTFTLDIDPGISVTPLL